MIWLNSFSAYSIYLHDALPIYHRVEQGARGGPSVGGGGRGRRRGAGLLPGLLTRRRRDVDRAGVGRTVRSEEHTSELQSRLHLVCRLLLEKKNFNSQPF